MPSSEEFLHKVVDQESFIEFVEALADEREKAEQMEREDPVRFQLGGAMNWQNVNLSSFLHAAVDYFTVKPFHHPEKSPSWKMFAEFLYFGKIIE